MTTVWAATGIPIPNPAIKTVAKLRTILFVVFITDGNIFASFG
jgi:hypothetical protein